MRTKIALLILAAAAWAGCNPFNFRSIAGSGNVVSTNLTLAGFHAIEAGSTFDVHIKSGDQCAVTVTTDDNLFDDLDVARDGEWLRLRLKSGANIRPTTLRADITVPTLTDLDASGASRMTFSPFAMDHFGIDSSGASSIHGEINAKTARIECSGASKAEISGTAATAELSGSGASHLQCAKLIAQRADVDLSGASKADIHAGDELNYDLSGASHLNYFGNPRVVRSDCSGASKASAEGR